MYLADMKSALSSSTANALLGLLSIKPMSGYDLRQFIPESIGHFWSESYGQIYPTLRRMAEEGLVEKRTETQQGKPDRHIYSLTGAGHERLQHWLELPFADEVPRNELLLKMFFGVHAPATVNRKHIRTFLEQQEHDLNLYTNIAGFLRTGQAGNPQLPYWLITLNPRPSRSIRRHRLGSRDARGTRQTRTNRPAEPKPQRTRTRSGGTPWSRTRSG